MLLALCMLAGFAHAEDRPVPPALPALPVLAGDNLVEESHSLPADLDADRNVVVLAFKKRHQADTDDCYPAVADAAATAGSAPWELLMLPTSMPGFARALMRRGLVRATDAGVRQQRKLLVFGDPAASRTALGIDGPDQIQLLVVDRAGRVRWRSGGPCTDALLDDLRAAVADGSTG